MASACARASAPSVQEATRGVVQTRIAPQTAANSETPSSIASFRIMNEALSSRRRARSLHRHALGEVSRLVHVAAAQHSQVVREELKRHGDQKGLKPLQARGDRNHEICGGPDVLFAFGA